MKQSFFLFLALMLVNEARSQTVYIATDTLELEVGSGSDLGPNGKNGIWEYPFDNNPKNNTKFRATFLNDTLNGTFEAFWPNGKRHVLITFEMGYKTGEALYYGENGSLKYRMFYRSDTLDGLFIEYYKSGAKMKELSFRKGLLHGVCRAYHDGKAGALHAEGEFSDGLPNGNYTNWVDSKRKIVETFERGYPLVGQRIFVWGELVGELILNKDRREYEYIVSYKRGVKVQTDVVPEPLRRDFMYGKYLFLPPNFR